MLDEKIESVAEAATDYHSPCCEGEGLYAHFAIYADGSEALCGFQCTGCNKNYDPSEKDEFEL